MSGKAGRSGPRPTPGAAEVVPLFRAGLRPVDIVKRVKLCRQRVCQILTAAGLDPKGRAAATR